MKRKVFYSFHYLPDNWRASQVRQIGAIEGNQAASDNDWETVTKGGDAAIKKWIDDQMKGRTCLVVLAGKETAKRKWVDYEIEKAWKDGLGVVGIHIHHLKDRHSTQTTKGSNPFSHLSFGTKIKIYDTPHIDSQKAYGYISDNISTWIEESIKARS